VKCSSNLDAPSFEKAFEHYSEACGHVPRRWEFTQETNHTYTKDNV
jgi:hypothetical protein